jgi:ABC-type oligopeptide transport system substrate-binding subunit
LGRQFELPRRAVWSDGRPVSSADIDFSLNLLRAGKGVGRSRVWGDLLTDAESKRDRFLVTLPMRQGFLDPLGLMTFKILPSYYRQEFNLQKFAEHPVSSGPFRLDGLRSDEQNVPCLFFAANPDYGTRPTKKGTPHIQEIRFYTYRNPVEELSTGKLDLALDLTANEAADLLDKRNTGNLPIELPLPSEAVPNRRIYFLAINTVKLNDAGLRRAISCAIDREKLLDKHFRGSLKGKVHKALNGPFPVGSWACKQNQNDPANRAGQSLFDQAEAGLLIQQPAAMEAKKNGPFQLKYPDDDPVLGEAIKDLCAQVKELTGVVLEPRPLPPDRLREDIEDSKSFDLAYYHYDFPDEGYWLAPLFGPPPGSTDARNIFKFMPTDLSKLLSGMKTYRDFTKVREHQWETHKFLNHEMPFIPLWQLDPLLAYRRDVQPASVDPLLVFNNIEEWRVLRK